MPYLIGDKHVLADVAIFTNNRRGGNMGPVPDTGAFADSGAGVDDGGFVIEIRHRNSFKF